VGPRILSAMAEPDAFPGRPDAVAEHLHQPTPARVDIDGAPGSDVRSRGHCG